MRIDAGAVGEAGFPAPFGPYTLLSCLSASAMAEQFLAVQRSPSGFEKLVILKRILASRSADPSFVAMFAREARLAAMLSHPNVVQTYDAGEVDGRYFIAMEYVHGEDLAAVLEAAAVEAGGGGPAMPLEHALGIVLSVCQGLAYVHERRDLSGAPLGIIHRDVCSRNIVIGFGGDVKVVDFGVAKSDGDDGEETLVATLKGKIGYMSPEQVAGGDLDCRTDIFALGVVLFELTTGRRPFAGRSDVETLTLVRDAACPRPSEVVATYPPALERIVMRALQKRQDDRYPNVRAMQADLERFVRDRRLALSSADLGAWMQAIFKNRVDPRKSDLISAQQRRWAGGAAASVESPTTSVSQSLAPSSTGATDPPPPPPERGARGRASWFAVAGALTLLTGTVIYMGRGIEREMAARTELLREYHEEQALRPAAPEAPEPTGALEITSHPPGAAIWLNGTLRGEVTPATLGKLPLEHELHLKVTKDGFDTFRTTTRVTDESPYKELDVELRAIPGSVVVHPDPAEKAGVWVDGKPWRGDHWVVDGLAPNVEHWLTVAAPGYVARMSSVTLAPGEERTLNVKLVRSAGPSARPASTP
jgi:serine/threonine-protein kinase